MVISAVLRSIRFISLLMKGFSVLSNLEETMSFQFRAVGLPPPERELRFAANYVGLGAGVRKRLKDQNLSDWRFDFAWSDYKLAVEVEGGVFSGGRHTRGKGFVDDCKKYNSALLLGWRVFRFTDKTIKSGQAVRMVERFIYENCH